MNNQNSAAKSKAIAVLFVLIFVLAPLVIGFLTGKVFSAAVFLMAAVLPCRYCCSKSNCLCRDIKLSTKLYLK